MKWKNLLNLQCPQDKCAGKLIDKHSDIPPHDVIHACTICSYYITHFRFQEIVSNIKNPIRYGKLEPPEFIKKLREQGKKV